MLPGESSARKEPITDNESKAQTVCNQVCGLKLKPPRHHRHVKRHWLWKIHMCLMYTLCTESIKYLTSISKHTHQMQSPKNVKEWGATMQRFHPSIHPAPIYTRGSFYPATKRRTGTRTTEISLDGVELIRETFSRERERNKSSSPHS